MIDFKGNQYPKGVILYAVFFYVRYAVSYCDLEEIMEERGVEVDHATLSRWVVKYSAIIACHPYARDRKPAHPSVWMKPILRLKESGANLAGLLWTNIKLKFQNGGKLIKILQVKYLNNILEQDHRFIKKLTRPMMGLKSFSSASATLRGIEVAHMICKHQFGKTNLSAFQQFAALAG